jgi:hypothetical protein
MRSIKIDGSLVSLTDNQYLALWKILENILKCPGINQSHLLNDASSFSHIGASDLLSDNDCKKLWEKQELVFPGALQPCFWPNKLTERIFKNMDSPVVVFTEIFKGIFRTSWETCGHGDITKIKPGDLVVFTHLFTKEEMIAVFIEFVIKADSENELTAKCFNDLKCPITPNANRSAIKRTPQYNHYDNLCASILYGEKIMKVGITRIKQYGV